MQVSGLGKEDQGGWTRNYVWRKKLKVDDRIAESTSASCREIKKKYIQKTRNRNLMTKLWRCIKVVYLTLKT